MCADQLPVALSSRRRFACTLGCHAPNSLCMLARKQCLLAEPGLGCHAKVQASVGRCRSQQVLHLSICLL